MIARCNNENCQSFPYYGARGVRVCKRWLNSFERYAADVGNPPFPGAHLSRINPKGNYRPGNVHWLTQSENLKTSRGVVRVRTIAGEQTIADAARDAGKNPASVRNRVKSGMSPCQAILAERSLNSDMHGKYHVPELTLKTIRSLAIDSRVSYSMMRWCLGRGMTVDEAIEHARGSWRDNTKAAAARRLCISKTAISLRINKLGWSVEDAMTLPAGVKPKRKRVKGDA